MLAWHYTTGQKFVQIVERGVLLPTARYVKPPEKPILWFSLHPYWEPTANKLWVQDGGRRTLTMRETFQRARGLVRFGCDVRDLLMGEALRRKAGMSASVWRGLAAEGRRQGAKPSDWCGTVAPVPIDDLVVEVMDADFQWQPVTAA